MKTFFQKPFRGAAVFAVVLAAFTAFVLLDAFVIPRALVTVASAAEATVTADESVTSAAAATATEAAAETESASSSASVTATSYDDGNISISIETLYVDDTAVYIADVTVSDASYLKTAFADATYGRNIKAATSDIAEDNNAIFAINGDYYGFRDDGFVLRNGVLYRDAATDGDALVIDSAGNFSIVDENTADAQSLVDSGAWQILSFGPALIDGGEITVTENSEVNQSMRSNPRTAIGQISALHYIFVVSDGRTQQSAGLTLFELAQIMADKGCVVAYNLDGGGSSTMWFNGEIVNIPTDGNSYGERSVSDIVYIGY